MNVIRDGKLFTVESMDICRGDVIKVEGGDLVSREVWYVVGMSLEWHFGFGLLFVSYLVGT